MYEYNGNWIPERYTTVSIAADGPGLEDHWIVDYNKNFIRISMGASMQREINKWPGGKPVIFTSRVFASKLDR